MMAPADVVVGQEVGKRCRTCLSASVDAVAKHGVYDGADEAFAFAIGLWTSRTRSHMAHAQQPAGQPPAIGIVGRMTVGEHALNADADAGVPGSGALEEAGAGVRLLVGQHFPVGHARAV